MQFDQLHRRGFMTLLGGAAAWPLAARGQQPAAPVVGLLSGIDPDNRQLAAFRQGLNEVGYIAGKSVTIEHRSAAGRYDRLPALAERSGATPSDRDRYNPRHHVGPLGQSRHNDYSNRLRDWQ